MIRNRLGWIAAAVVGPALLVAPAVLRPDSGDPDRVVVRVERIADRPWDSHESTANWYARRYGISRPLARTILREARAQLIDPGIVFGLIAAESRFNPRAVGREGERGLMQIKLQTARVYQRDVTPQALLRPETNLRLGLLHLKREVEHFGHDWTLGLLAYNMGRGRLVRALRSGRAPETGYAAAVLAHLRERPL